MIPLSYAIDITEQLFREQASGLTRHHTPIKVPIPGADSGRHFRAVSGALLARGVVGARLGVEGHSIANLFDVESGELVCVMGYPFSKLRTAATIGLATKWLAPPGEAIVAMIGSGDNALGLLQGVVEVRPVHSVRVYSRNAINRQTFAEAAAKTLHLPVRAVASSKEALRDASIVCVATNSGRPVIDCADIAPHAHVNSMGLPSELPKEIYERSYPVFVGSKFQKLHADSYHEYLKDAPRDVLCEMLERGQLDWSTQIFELGDVFSDGWHRPEGTTVFVETSGGCGDLMLAEYVYRLASEKGMGVEIDLC